MDSESPGGLRRTG